MKNTNKKIKRIVPAAVALCLLSSPVINSTAQSFLPSSAPSSIVMTLDADAASSKKKKEATRKGKSKAYISCLIPGKMSFTICMNKDSEINDMINALEQMSFWTSGCKNGKKVIDFGSLFIKDPASRKILTKVSNVFKNLNGVSKSAGKAAKSLKSLAKNKKYKDKGLKVTMRQKGNWLIEVQ